MAVSVIFASRAKLDFYFDFPKTKIYFQIFASRYLGISTNFFLYTLKLGISICEKTKK